MMNIDLWRKSPIELNEFMNMPYHMDYAHTHVPMQTIKCHQYYDTLDISDISEFKDIKTTSSDKDIPPLQGQWILKDWLELNIYSYKNSQYYHIIFISPLSFNRSDIMTFSLKLLYLTVSGQQHCTCMAIA